MNFLKSAALAIFFSGLVHGAIDPLAELRQVRDNVRAGNLVDASRHNQTLLTFALNQLQNAGPSSEAVPPLKLPSPGGTGYLLGIVDNLILLCRCPT